MDTRASKFQIGIPTSARAGLTGSSFEPGTLRSSGKLFGRFLKETFCWSFNHIFIYWPWPGDNEEILRSMESFRLFRFINFKQDIVNTNFYHVWFDMTQNLTGNYSYSKRRFNQKPADLLLYFSSWATLYMIKIDVDFRAHCTMHLEKLTQRKNGISLWCQALIDWRFTL